MPGHVKRGGTGEPDPDPSPFLFVSWEDKQNDMAKVILILQLYITILKQDHNSKLQSVIDLHKVQKLNHWTYFIA